jgi:hypothetical protein
MDYCVHGAEAARAHSLGDEQQVSMLQRGEGFKKLQETARTKRDGDKMWHRCTSPTPALVTLLPVFPTT